jgi:hypothetical protein
LHPHLPRFIVRDHRNSTAGFAIALVLLTIALIAVILGALAASTRNVYNSRGNEKDRGQAASVNATAKSIENQIVSHIGGTGIKGYQLHAIRSGSTAQLNADGNLWRPAGNINPPAVLTDAYEGTACTTANQNKDNDPDGCTWYLTALDMGLGKPAPTTGATLAEAEIAVYTFPLKLFYCQQLNHNLLSSSLDQTPSPVFNPMQWNHLIAPTTANPRFANLTSIGTTTTTTPAAIACSNTACATPLAQPPTINGSPRNEFCGTGNNLGNNLNIYAKVVLVQ